MLFLDISTFCQCHPQLIYDQRRTGKKSNYELPFLSFSYCHIFSECGWLLQERNTNKEELDRMARQFVFFRLPFFFISIHKRYLVNGLFFLLSYLFSYCHIISVTSLIKLVGSVIVSLNFRRSKNKISIIFSLLFDEFINKSIWAQSFFMARFIIIMLVLVIFIF